MYTHIETNAVTSSKLMPCMWTLFPENKYSPKKKAIWVCCWVSCFIEQICYSCLDAHTLPASISLQSTGRHYTHQPCEVDILVITIQLRVQMLLEVTWRKEVKELTRGLFETIASSADALTFAQIFVPLELSVGDYSLEHPTI